MGHFAPGLAEAVASVSLIFLSSGANDNLGLNSYRHNKLQEGFITMKIASMITAIDYVGSQPKTMQLHAKLVVPEMESPIRAITLEFFEQQKSVKVIGRVKSPSRISFDLWDLTNALRAAGVLSAEGTLVFGGEAIDLVSGRTPNVAEQPDLHHELLQDETGTE